MQRLVICKREEVAEKVENMLSNFPDDDVRVIIQSPSEYQVDATKIRKFFMGAVLPEVTKILTNKSAEEIARNPEIKRKTYIKMKQILLPPETAYQMVGGVLREIKVVGSMSGKTTKEWSLFISAIKETIERDYGVMLSATSDGATEYYTALQQNKKDKKFSAELDRSIGKIQDAFGM